MYFNESSGAFGTQGLASADQFSCHRLKRMTGRAHDAGTAGAGVAFVFSPLPAAVSVSAAAAGSATARPMLSAHARKVVFMMSLLLAVMHFRDVPAREFDYGSLS